MTRSLDTYLKIGEAAWSRLRDVDDDADALEVLRTGFDDRVEAELERADLDRAKHPEFVRTLERLRDRSAALGMNLLTLQCARWVQDAATRLEPDHKRAAALMATKIGADVVEDLILPWRAVVLHVPAGLLHVDGVTYHRARFMWFKTSQVGWARYQFFIEADEPFGKEVRNSYTFATNDLTSEEDFAGRADPDRSYGEVSVAAKERVSTLVKRLLVGCLLALQHSNNFTTGTWRGRSSPRDPRGEPDHRIIYFGGPVAADCRQAVSDYAAGKLRSAPTVQTLVVGHHKRQVIGASRSGRKVIWVEPYWRGPEEAPILSRPRRIG